MTYPCGLRIRGLTVAATFFPYPNLTGKHTRFPWRHLSHLSPPFASNFIDIPSIPGLFPPPRLQTPNNSSLFHPVYPQNAVSLGLSPSSYQEVSQLTPYSMMIRRTVTQAFTIFSPKLKPLLSLLPMLLKPSKSIRIPIFSISISIDDIYL